MATSSTRIAKHRFYEPSRNLPSHNSRGGESRFTYRFAQAYIRQFSATFRGEKGHIVTLAREIPANGYGIADLVAVRWRPILKRTTISVEDFVVGRTVTVHAFEIKLRNWRQALLQANRYRHIANLAIAVIPSDQVRLAMPYIETFRLLNVGLWSFDGEKEVIRKHYTPRSRLPLDSAQGLKVIEKVAKASKALPIC